jgi:transposase
MNDMILETDTSTHTSDRMSASRQRIEVITGIERRRRWSIDQKMAIVKESMAPHATVAEICRKHDLGTGQLYTWRRELMGAKRAGEGCFASVDVMGEPLRATGTIEIALPWGASVRVDAGVDEPALRRVLAALRG